MAFGAASRQCGLVRTAYEGWPPYPSPQGARAPRCPGRSAHLRSRATNYRAAKMSPRPTSHGFVLADEKFPPPWPPHKALARRGHGPILKRREAGPRLLLSASCAARVRAQASLGQPRSARAGFRDRHRSPATRARAAETLEEGWRWRSQLGAPDWEVDTWLGSYVAIAKGDLEPVSDAVMRITRHGCPLGAEDGS